MLIITGLMVICWTLGNIRMTTSPSLCNNPKIGGLSPASVPRPRFPFSRRRLGLRPALATLDGCPLCPATMYTSSASTTPLNWTDFFSTRHLLVTVWSFPEPHSLTNLTLLQFDDSKGSDPSNTNTAPRFSRIGGVLQRSFHSNHQTVSRNSYNDSVAGELANYENHVC